MLYKNQIIKVIQAAGLRYYKLCGFYRAFGKNGFVKRDVFNRKILFFSEKRNFVYSRNASAAKRVYAYFVRLLFSFPILPYFKFISLFSEFRIVLIICFAVPEGESIFLLWCASVISIS